VSAVEERLDAPEFSQLARAGLWDRLISAFVDSFLMTLAIYGLACVLSPLINGLLQTSADAGGKPIKIYDVDWSIYDIEWIIALGTFVYLVALEHRLGATVGKRLLGLRVVDADQPAQVGIPLQKAIMRNFLMWAPQIPVFVVTVAAEHLTRGRLEDLEPGFFYYSLVATCLLALFIYAWMVTAIVRKRDPIYDAIAGTAVIRT
jgi:uncharacterized RDD family membrane protein YckC